jgi:hypothetical protein
LTVIVFPRIRNSDALLFVYHYLAMGAPLPKS